MDEFFAHENAPVPPSLSEEGKLREGTKSDLLPILEEMAMPTFNEPHSSAVIIDGVSLVQSLPLGSAKNSSRVL